MKLLSAGLIKNVKAQSGDALARPTFDTDIDLDDDGGNNGGNPPPPPSSGGDAAGKITLKTTATNFTVGKEFEIDVEVDSDGEELSSFTVKIQFNSDFLQVVDSDPAKTGTQVDYTSTVFTESQNEVSNNTGTIIIKGQTTTAATLEAVVAKIKFVTIAEGNAEVKITATESSLVDSTSANILEDTNGLQINVGDNIGEPSEIVDDDLIPEGEIDDLKDLPKSDLPFQGVLYVVAGVLLIYIGLMGRRIAGRSKNRK